MSDKWYSNVELLCGFNGADAATSFTEESNSRSTTFSGNAQLDTAQAKWGSSSLLLDGTGDFVSWTDSGDFTLGTSAFCIEAWVRWNSISAGVSQNIIAHWLSSTNNRGFNLSYNTSFGLQFQYSTAGTFATQVSVAGAWSPTTGVWYHVAADRSGSSLKVFADGVVIATHNIASDSIFNAATLMRCGSLDGTQVYFNGWIDDLRLTVGRSRYQSNFTLPQGPFSRGKRLGVLGEYAQPVISFG